MAANPSRVIVQLGANVEQLVAGMNQAIAAIKGSTSQISGQLQGMSATSQKAAADLQAGLDRAALSVRNLIGPLAQLFTVYEGFSAAKGFIELGIATNAAMQTAQLGIASLIIAQGTLKDAQGNTITGAKAFDAAMALSADQVQKLRIAGLQTIATTTQLTDAFKSAVASGLAAGLSLDQIRDITVRITQAAGAMGLPMDQLRQEVTSILRGTIDRNSVVAKNLNLTNEEVKAWKEQRVLADRLMERLGAFGVAGEKIAMSWAGVTSNMKEAEAVLAGIVTQPLFERLGAGLGEAFKGLFDVDAGRVSDSLTGLVDAARSVFAGIGDTLQEWIRSAISGLQALSQWFGENRARVAAFASAVGALVTASAGALGNLVGAFAAVANAGIGPLTFALNALASILDTTVGQLLTFAVILGGPVLNAMRTFGSLATAIFSIGPALAGFQTAVQTSVIGPIGQMAATFQFARATGAGLGETILGMVNPWYLLAAGAAVAVFAIERWLSANRRAAEERARNAAHILQESEEWNRLSLELLANEAALAKLQGPSEEQNRAAEHSASLIDRLKAIYPEFNNFLKDEAGHYRSAAEALHLFNAERLKGLDVQIVEAQGALTEAQARQEADKARFAPFAVAIGGFTSPLGLLANYRLNQDTTEIQKATKALEDLKTAREKVFGSEFTGPLPQLTPNKPAGGGGGGAPGITADKIREGFEKLAKEQRAAEEKAAKEQSEEQRKIAELRAREAADLLKQREDTLKADADFQAREVDIEEKHWKALFDAGEVGQAEYLAGLQKFEDQRFEIEKQALAEQLQLHLLEEEAWNKYQQDMRALEQRHTGKTQEIRDQSLPAKKAGTAAPLGAQLTGGIQGAVLGMTDTWAAGLQKMLQGQLSFSQAIRGLWRSLADGIIGEMLRILVRWITTKTMELLFHRTVESVKQQGSSQTATKEVTNQAVIAGAVAGSSLAQIGAHAGVAAAGGAQAMASIPYVGPILAIAAIAAILGAVLALRSQVKSAAGGFDVGPGDNPLTQLHASEMVLPAELAERVRSITTPVGVSSLTPAIAGGGPGGLNINFGGVHAFDKTGVERVLMRAKGPLTKVIKQLHREGRFRG